MTLPHGHNVVEISPRLARCQADDFASSLDPAVRTFGRRFLARAVFVVIDEKRDRLDAGEHWKISHAVGTAGCPRWLQQRPTMRDVKRSRERAFDAFAQYKTGSDRVIRPKANHATGHSAERAWLLTSLDRAPPNATRFAGHRVRIARDLTAGRTAEPRASLMPT